jgi:hypothetical protein
MRNINGPFTRENFLAAAKGKTFEMDGLKLDFTDDNQGSDLVEATYLQDGDYAVIEPDDLGRLLVQ